MATAEMIGPGGYGVTVLGRAGMRYREGDRTVYVDGEMAVGAYDFCIFEKSIQQWEKTGAAFDEAKRQEIIVNIRATFELHGLKLLVD